MEKQYIGARYVPKFADPIEWNAQTTYEPLTIVTYLGASYTSKKAVPAGVNPTDNSYWVVTGNYNAQVEEYRQNVLQYRGEVNEVKNNVKRNVKDYGAVGNGVTDDTNAIKTALGACRNGDILYFPEGAYVCSDSITLLSSIHVMGAGMYHTTLMKPSNPTSGVGVYAVVPNCKLSDMTINGNGCAEYGVLGYRVNNFIVENVAVINRNGIGVGLSNCYRCNINNVTVSDIGGLKPAFWTEFDDVNIEHGYHTFTNCVANNVSLDGLIVNEHYVTIRDCVFSDCGKGSPTDGSLGACGIYCGPNGVKGVIIDGCITDNNSECGIDLNAATESRIINNTCRNNGLCGITGVYDNCVIHNNICSNNGNNPTTGNPTLWLKAGIGLRNARNVSIVGNRCYDTRSPAKQTYGIQIEKNDTEVYNICVVANNLKYNLTDDTNFGSGYPANPIEGLVFEGLNS